MIQVAVDRAPPCAGLLAGAAMAAVVAFWALLALVGGNGFHGLAGDVWIGGNALAALLAWGFATWWAMRWCRAWRRRGWPAGRAIAASALLATLAAVLVLLACGIAMIGVAEWLR